MKMKTGSTIREILKVVLIALVIFLVMRVTVQTFVVDGCSMEPNVHDGEFLVVNKIVYHLHSPRRGDVIVFQPPKNPKRDFIKRVIGLPGDEIAIEDGYVYVNGQLLEEDYFSEKPRGSYYLEEVPPDSYFVLGDNRNCSSDSRYWGMVPRGNIVGKAWFFIWPVSAWGGAPNYSLQPAN